MASPGSKPLSFSSVKVGPLPAPKVVEPQDEGASQTALTAAETPQPPAAAQTIPPAVPLAAAQIATRIEEPEPRGGAIYALALAACLIWLGALAAYVGGFQLHAGGGVSLAPAVVGILVVVALGPMALIWAGAYAVVQGRALAAETRRARRLTDELVGPTAVAASRAGAVVEAVRAEIVSAAEAANRARAELTALQEALALETGRLNEAAADAARNAHRLTETLSQERGELGNLALSLDARTAAVVDAINRQAHMVAEAADLAEVQLREGEAAMAARAADLAAAAGEALDASRVAADDLGRQIARLETASLGVGDQARALEDGLTEQRAALVTVAHALRAEQEDFTALAESRTAQLAEFVTNARADVTALNDATHLGAESLAGLIGEARGKLHELAEAASLERNAFLRSSEDTLKTLSEAGERERNHLESAMRSTLDALSAAAADAREAADVHAEAARARVDLLNEAAFTAGQKADQVFEARLNEAQSLIEQSVRLVEDAGERAGAKLEAQVAGARQAVADLARVIDQVSARAAELPGEAEAKTGEIRAAVERGLDDLLASARKAAEETQAIDAAFQERVKRNYEMLSEAVQLMGVVASGGQGASVLQRASPVDRARGRLAAASQEASGAAAGRGRLRLTPTTTEEAPAAPAQAEAEAPGADDAGWTWKELLTSIDGDAANDDARLGESLFADVESMGVDPSALLPRGRIEEIAAAVQSGDGLGAREVVRTLAPAAIRRIARRLLSDTTFRTRAQTFVRRYGEVIAEAMNRDGRGLEAATLLGSNAGRAYLLLDAAAGQPG
jgi:hypothetical protein